MKTTDKKIFISHSTQDVRDFTFAKRVSEYLQGLGVKIWIAPESIPVGAKWEFAIIRSLLDDATHCIVILSATSIASEWVLKEIDLVKRRYTEDESFIIIPIIMGLLPDFPNRDFLSQFQAIHYSDRINNLLQISSALQIFSLLKYDVQHFISALSRNFVGRAHIIKIVQDIIQNGDGGYFIVEGEPGMGKSALMAHLVQKFGYFAHFINQAMGITKVNNFLESICTQLLSYYELPYQSVPEAAFNDGAFLYQLLIDVSSYLPKSEKLVIIIDALDELEWDIEKSQGNILFLPNSLPRNVHIILSTRPKYYPLVTYTPKRTVNLMDFPNENSADVVQYLRNAAKKPNISSWIEQSKISVDRFTDILLEKSECNFMYLKYVLGDIERDVYRGLGTDAFPFGLNDYYSNHWRRMGMLSSHPQREKLEIIYVLSETQKPISRELLADLTGYDQMFVQVVLDEWRQFLRVVEDDLSIKLYSIYHKSFQDFLHRKDIVQAAGVTLGEVNRKITDQLWSSIF